MMKVAALSYARIGWPVLPLREGGKEPIISGGVHSATCDPVEVIRLWNEYPNANVGVATGNMLGAIFVDVDGRNDGYETLAALELDNGPLPSSITGLSGSGNGYHIGLSIPDGLHVKTKLGQGVDLPRYVVVPPSIHPKTGRRYEWKVSPFSNEFAAAPQWLLDLARAEIDPAPPFVEVPSDDTLLIRAKAYLDACPPAISGQGGSDHTFLVAQKIVRGFGLGESQAVQLLSDWNQKCEPPWSARELKRKVREAITRGRMTPGSML